MPKKKSEKEVTEKKTDEKKPTAKSRKPAASAKPAFTPAKPASKPASKKKVVISTEEISLRAYFIAERRGKMGWPGDSTSDWVEAERQLRAEAARNK